MDSHKTYADGFEDTDLFGGDTGSASDLREAAAGRKPTLGRPARQRVEELEEAEWLKRQLSDWDDLDLEDDDEFDSPL